MPWKTILRRLTSKEKLGYLMTNGQTDVLEPSYDGRNMDLTEDHNFILELLKGDDG